ncbi:LytR/AlgR family response regulator transcription factor [Parapedobacter sp. 10938]|uniref:LytR/AlgR family response regulator transcription factor n=1 Tax=Parapedobacter flavus TaxID=3110225 RepID=UPI002DB6416B|nr:LytTR family DNA-binding domain-containing protein [Parapedobacter sp. 10938]MEC3880786.1 LytTR family DNA-binding domain-containing protein [Parapedobacter sp. 10938]
MQKAIIIEDEVRSRELLHDLVIANCPEVQVVAQTGAIGEAVELIRAHQPHLLFLDIELQTGTGFEILQQVADLSPAVIFTTAYDHYAIKAIKFSAADYLLKPIDIDELKEAVSKVLSRSVESHQQMLSSLIQNLNNMQHRGEPTLTLSLANELEFVPLQNIIRIEAAGAYSTFYLTCGRNIMVSKNLKEYEVLLTGHQFMRIHNSHIINLNEIKRMLKTDGGYAVMSDDFPVMISPKKKETFIQMMNNRNL